LRNWPDVEQVVWHAAALGDCELRRADIHAPVELHGVGVYYLAAERVREGHR